MFSDYESNADPVLLNLSSKVRLTTEHYVAADRQEKPVLSEVEHHVAVHFRFMTKPSLDRLEQKSLGFLKKLFTQHEVFNTSLSCPLLGERYFIRTFGNHVVKNSEIFENWNKRSHWLDDNDFRVFESFSSMPDTQLKCMDIRKCFDRLLPILQVSDGDIVARLIFDDRTTEQVICFSKDESKFYHRDGYRHTPPFSCIWDDVMVCPTHPFNETSKIAKFRPPMNIDQIN